MHLAFYMGARIELSRVASTVLTEPSPEPQDVKKARTTTRGQWDIQTPTPVPVWLCYDWRRGLGPLQLPSLQTQQKGSSPWEGLFQPTTADAPRRTLVSF